MSKHDILYESILMIARRAGIDKPVFHLTSVSRDDAGVFIMQTTWPQGKLVYDSLADAVPGFPTDPYTTCVALLPHLVEEIVWVACEADDDERSRGVEARRL